MAVRGHCARAAALPGMGGVERMENGKMSYYDYKKSQEIEAEGYPFYALVMACMRQADTDNLELLENAFPKVYAELAERYHTPGGLISSELGKLDSGGHA